MRNDEQMQVIKGKVNDGYSWTISITGDLADSLTATKEEKKKREKVKKKKKKAKGQTEESPFSKLRDLKLYFAKFGIRRRILPISSIQCVIYV